MCFQSIEIKGGWGGGIKDARQTREGKTDGLRLHKSPFSTDDASSR